MDNTNVKANSRPAGVLRLMDGRDPASCQRCYHAREVCAAPGPSHTIEFPRAPSSGANYSRIGNAIIATDTGFRTRSELVNIRLFRPSSSFEGDLMQTFRQNRAT